MEGTKKRSGDKTSHRGIKSMGGGRYRVRVYVTDPRTGKSKERDRVIEAQSIKDAARKRLDLQREAAAEASGEHVSKPSRRIGDVATAWLEHKLSARRVTAEGSRSRLCPTTRSRYESTVKNVIVPMLGDVRVDRISRSDVERWRDTMGGQYRAATVNGHLRVLRSILADAGNAEAARARVLTEDDCRITDEEPNLLTAEELDRFFEVSGRRFPQHHALLAVLCTTAMRISTAIALKREDFEPQHARIVVRRRRSGGEVVEGVKRSRAAVDHPPLMPEVWAVVQAEWAASNDAQKASGLAFPSKEGGFRARSCLDKPIAAICKEAGITQRFTPHGCRRTGADLYRRSGGERIAMAVAGHTTVEMHRRYTRVDATERMRAAEKAFSGLRLVRPETGDRTGEAGDQDVVTGGGERANVAS